MIALLLAAQVAAAQPAAPRYVLPMRGDYVIREVRNARSADARQMQTSFEPALLFRPQDRAAAVPRKLKDLPPAKSCLVGAAGNGGR